MAEHFQNLGPSVRFERSASVFGQSKWIGRPRCSGYLDHHTRSVVTAAELPQPPTAVNSRARAQAEVCPDLPGHERLSRISIWLRRSTREHRRRSLRHRAMVTRRTVQQPHPVGPNRSVRMASGS